MNALRQDLRYVLRTLRGTPMLTAVITVTLALGIGATTGIFSVVNAVLLRPLPYQSSESLVELFDTQKDTRELSASYETPFRLPQIPGAGAGNKKNFPIAGTLRIGKLAALAGNASGRPEP